MESYDVIVIGAGLAGLSAARELSARQRKVLVLEANPQPGGRILTHTYKHLSYDLGALFAVNDETLPFETPSASAVHLELPVEMFVGGHLYSGNSPWECIRQTAPDLRQITRLQHFLNCETPQPDYIGQSLYESLNAFFRVIHPGNITDYLPERRRDALIRFDTAYPANGNADLIAAFQKQIPLPILINRRVTEVIPGADGVRIQAAGPEGIEHFRSHWVIIAAPPAGARLLTKNLGNSLTTAFLDGLTVPPGAVVTAGISGMSAVPVSYLVSPDRPINTIFFRVYPNEPDITLVTAYLIGGNAESTNVGDDAAGELIRRELNCLGFGPVEKNQIEFTDTARWPEIGPVISRKAYGDFSPACLHPAEKVVLAGDYAWWDGTCMPYGMKAAIASGSHAARMIFDDSVRSVSKAFMPAPLFRTSVMRLGEKGPNFLETIEDGDIAFYGLILQSEPDAELEKYLAEAAEDGLWPFHRGYGVTSLDSALVIEGLLAGGHHRQLLERGAERLAESFFDPSEGGFRTLPHSREGRAPYWGGVDCLATAHCAWLLHRIAPIQYADIIEASAAYLIKKQLLLGSWPGKWFTSRILPVYLALRFLSESGMEKEMNFNSAKLWLMSHQQPDGSWFGSVLETAPAVLSVDYFEDAKEAAAKGREWLLNHNTVNGQNGGEPVLVYWFEEKGQKTLYYSHDKGRIAAAWAKRALNPASESEEK